MRIPPEAFVAIFLVASTLLVIGTIFSFILFFLGAYVGLLFGFALTINLVSKIIKGIIEDYTNII